MEPDLENKQRKIDTCFEALLNARGLDKSQFTYDGEGSEEIEVATGKASKAEEEQAQNFLDHYDEKLAEAKKRCEENVATADADLKESHDSYVAMVRGMRQDYLNRMKKNEAIQQNPQKLEEAEKTATEEEFNNGIFNVEVKGETMAKTFKRMSADNGYPWWVGNKAVVLAELLDFIIPDSISYSAEEVYFIGAWKRSLATSTCLTGRQWSTGSTSMWSSSLA